MRLTRVDLPTFGRPTTATIGFMCISLHTGPELEVECFFKCLQQVFRHRGDNEDPRPPRFKFAGQLVLMILVKRHGISVEHDARHKEQNV